MNGLLPVAGFPVHALGVDGRTWPSVCPLRDAQATIDAFTPAP